MSDTSESVIERHPTPWRVEYNQSFPDWHPRPLPRVVDDNGSFVIEPELSTDVAHPGKYDAKADALCQAIAAAVNLSNRRKELG